MFLIRSIFRNRGTTKIFFCHKKYSLLITKGKLSTEIRLSRKAENLSQKKEQVYTDDIFRRRMTTQNVSSLDCYLICFKVLVWGRKI